MTAHAVTANGPETVRAATAAAGGIGASSLMGGFVCSRAMDDNFRRDGRRGAVGGKF